MKPIGDVDIDNQNGVWIIALSGEHDLSNAGDLDERLRAMRMNGTRVVFDLSGASFIDSTAATRIIHLAQGEGEAAHDLAVVAPPGSQPRRVLDLIAANRLRVVESRAVALD